MRPADESHRGPDQCTGSWTPARLDTAMCLNLPPVPTSALSHSLENVLQLRCDRGRCPLRRLPAGRRAGPSKRAILKLYRSCPAEAMRGPIEMLAALDVPALVVWGTEDAYLPWTYAERQKEAFPSARVELLEGLGHWPFHEDPAQVAELVIPFLREQAGNRVS